MVLLMVVIGAVEVQFLLAKEFLDVRIHYRVWICICSQNILVGSYITIVLNCGSGTRPICIPKICEFFLSDFSNSVGFLGSPTEKRLNF